MIGCTNKANETGNIDFPVEEVVLTESASESQDSIFRGELIFGRFCGHCIGNCTPMFRFNSMGNVTTLWADYENGFFKGNGALKFATDLNQRELVDKAHQVVRELPEELVNATKDETTYGCPDCTDGCGIYIEFTNELGGNSKRFRLDWEPSDSISQEITEYANFVNSIINEIVSADN